MPYSGGVPDRPDAEVLPRPLRDAYREWSWRQVWASEGGCVTYRVERARQVHFVKLRAAADAGHPSLASEAARLRWARAHLPVPEVLDASAPASASASESAFEWLVTRALPGADATRHELRDDPARIVPLMARALRRFHEAPVARCPFSFRVAEALQHVEARIAAGLVDVSRDFHGVHAHLSAPAALELLRRTSPREEDLVVCHGDYCFPNVLFAGSRLAGFVDLGELGVADRWWDLAVATWSTTWNVGPGWEDLFLEAYGAPRDRGRAAFFRLLYDLVS